MPKKINVSISLACLMIVLIIITACQSKPSGQYEDNKMIAAVANMNHDKDLLELDITNWHNRKLKGNIDSYGVIIEQHGLNDMVLKDEDGGTLNRASLKKGKRFW